MSGDIPVIDLEPWFAGGARGEAAVVEAVRQACKGTGFFLITGHRVCPTLVARMYDTSRAFFDRPEAAKRQVPAAGPVKGGLMYFGAGFEKLAATLGEVTPGDLKESLDWGPGFGGGPWPDEPAGLKEVWQAYYDAMEGLARSLRVILARAAGLDDDFFEPFFAGHLSSVRVLNYPEPAGDPEPGQLRAGAHTDYGFLTVLLSEDRPGGLEVRNLAGDWVAPPVVPESFVVNLGDCLMRWTDDLWRSTPHRVVNPPPDAKGRSRRQSIAYFHNPAPDALIDTLPGFAKPGAGPKYPAITYGAYAVDRQRKSHGEQVSEVL